MHFDYLNNPTGSIYLIDCELKNKVLEYKLGIFPPSPAPEQVLRTNTGKSVKVALPVEIIQLQKRTVLLNRSFEIDQ